MDRLCSFSRRLPDRKSITNQILQGAPAEIAILSIERDAQRLKSSGICYR